MATGSTLSSAQETISGDHLECSICQERYDHPKILDCLHSFCEKCLEKYRSTTYQDATAIPCPVCRRETQLPETGVQDLRTNFHLIGLVEEFALQEKAASSGNARKRMCEVCGENQALYRCLDCTQNICSNCRKVHLQFQIMSSHNISELEDIHHCEKALENTQQKQHPECPKHESELTRLYCTTCEELICQECTASDHIKPQHTYVDCSQASSTRKQWLAGLISELQETLTDFQETRVTLSTMKRELGATVDRTVAEVQNRAAELRAEVTAQENRLIEEIQNLHKDRDQKLDEYEKPLGMISESLEYSLETATDVAHTASDSDFLSLYPTISKDLKSQSSRTPTKINHKLLCLKLKQSQRVGDIKLGKLELEGKWELCPQFGNGGSLVVPVQTVRKFMTSRVVHINPFLYPALAALDIAALDIAALHPDAIVTPAFNRLDVICSTSGSSKNTISVPNDVYRIAGIQDRIAVVSESAKVKVLNKDGKLAFEFPTVLHSAVGKTAVSLGGIAVKRDGTIIVGDVERNVLTEHSPADGSLIRTIPVKLRPHRLAVDSSDRVVISSSWCPEVVVADSNGVPVFSIKPTISGQPVDYCHGVCCDSSSGIYVVLENKGEATGGVVGVHTHKRKKYGEAAGHIHHYSARGAFIRCVVRDLQMPYAVTFTADGQKLAVRNRDSVNMYH